ncbi:MAG: PocR ligand-binding domain-containing protein [Eubacteriales bacterium]|nr:PocR ligand-binding domain-containing protein [Eubacteriales bacterium]
MSLYVAQEPLLQLLRDFHTLTGIRIVVFDDLFQEILTYPTHHCELCTLVRQIPAHLAECCQSDSHSFDECKQRGKLVIYRCHAGLIEATAPIKSNGVIIGYMMFGQITDNRHQLIDSVIERLQVPADQVNAWQDAARKVKMKHLPQIQAAAKIAEACTFYVLQKELVSLKHDRLIDKINQYLDDNLSQELDIHALASLFHISRTKLYDITHKQLGLGVGELIRRKRLEKAKVLLAESPIKIITIAEMIGFKDYTYFSKVFKKEYHLTPSEYRLKYQSI